MQWRMEGVGAQELEPPEHETCSDNFFYLLQYSSTLLYLNHSFSDLMTIYTLRFISLSGPQGFCSLKFFHFLIFYSQRATNYVSFCLVTNTYLDFEKILVISVTLWSSNGNTSSLFGWKCSILIYLKIC